VNDQELMKLLRAARRAEMQEFSQWLAAERKDCVSIVRARKIALNPAAATPEERAQIARCPHCARTIEQFGQGLTHPSLWSLVRWAAGLCESDEAKGMAWHVNDDACRRCNRLLRSAAVRGLAALLKRGTRAAEELESLADAAVGVLASMPAAAGAFATEPQQPHAASAQREDGGLRVSVRDTPAGELQATVSAPGQDMDGKKVWVELVGEKDSLSGEVTLRSQGPAGCGGRVAWPLGEALARLGRDYLAVAAPEEGGWRIER
jgi:hypothetical protein